MTRTGVLALAVAGTVLGLAGCGKTCDRTWKKLARCAGETAPDEDAEAAFRKQCRKLSKPALKRCLRREGCDRFLACVAKARAGTSDAATRCRRIWERGEACERRRDPRPADPEKRQVFDAYCSTVPAGDLDACLREEDCTGFKRCIRSALRGLRKREISRPVTPGPDAGLPGTPVDPTAELQILPNGELRLERVPLRLDQLEPVLRAARQEKPGLRIQIRADERTAHAEVVKVIDVLTGLNLRFVLAPAR